MTLLPGSNSGRAAQSLPELFIPNVPLTWGTLGPLRIVGMNEASATLHGRLAGTLGGER
jgi:hypothetical protein